MGLAGAGWGIGEPGLERVFGGQGVVIFEKGAGKDRGGMCGRRRSRSLSGGQPSLG